MFDVYGKRIYLTRGDTFLCNIKIYDSEGDEYTPQEGDVVRFAMKRTIADRTPCIEKVIPNDTLLLTIEPNDTKELDFGDYIYDVEITLADGTVDTFITDGVLSLGVEVD